MVYIVRRKPELGDIGMTGERKISSERKGRLEVLKQALDLEMKDLKLFDQAMTHSSFRLENPEYCDNERLEFLGDAVLKLVVSRYLFLNFADQDEGELSKIRSVLVSDRQLAQIAEDLQLGPFIRLGRGVDLKSSIISGAFEALLAAAYLDLGFEAVSGFIELRICSQAQSVSEDSVKENYKALLQELSQGREEGLPRYEVLSVDGPPHAPLFTVNVRIQERELGIGSGPSKKQAEQAAARAAYSALMNSKGLPGKGLSENLD